MLEWIHSYVGEEKMVYEQRQWVRGLLVLAVGGLIGCSVDVDNPTLSSGPTSESQTNGNGDTSSDGDSSTGDSPSDPSNGPSSDPSGDPDSSSSGGPSDAVCGNGVLEDGEACDGNEFGVACEDFGFDGGQLSCGPNCNAITEGCFGCGNGKLEASEECDGNDFGGETCQSLGDYVGGNLQCNSRCQIDDSGCIEPFCGDGIMNNDEVCDGNDFGNKTCQTEGNFNMGSLSCSGDCMSVDTSNCTLCQTEMFGSCANMPCCSGFCLPEANVCFPL